MVHEAWIHSTALPGGSFEGLQLRSSSKAKEESGTCTVDALNWLPQDNVNLLEADKTTVGMPEEPKNVLQQLHVGGHLGLKKTLKLFQRRFVGVQKKILRREVISECLGCQLGSDYKPLDVPKGKIESTSTWDVHSIDIMWPFVAGRRGERHILSIIDCFSRYLILIPLHDHTEMTVSRALYERVSGYFGCPRKILSDRGTEFTSGIWMELMELLGIQQLLTSPYYPKGDVIVERSHRTMSYMIHAHLVNRDDRGWVYVLPVWVLSVPGDVVAGHESPRRPAAWNQKCWRARSTPIR